MAKVYHYLSSILVTLFLCVTLLLVNLFQSLSVILLLVSRAKFRRFNQLCAEFWWGMAVASMHRVQKISMHFVGDTVPENENALIISNHTGLSDVLFILCLAKTRHRLGNLKWFAKDILKYVPGVGWGLWFLDNVFLKREWTKDQASIEATFENIKVNRIPIWLISFLEGTRRTPEKLRLSQEYARRKGIPALNHVLFPRTKGFVATICGMRDYLEAVYDITLAYSGRTPSLIDIAFGNVGPVYIHVKRHLINTLPVEDAELAKWAVDRYREKDELLEKFSQHQGFPFP